MRLWTRMTGTTVWTALALAALSTSAGFADPPSITPETIAPEPDCSRPVEILKMKGSSIQLPLETVIDNPRDWCDFWNDANQFIWPKPPCDLSGIDFDREVVVVVAIGSRPNTCFNLEAEKVCGKGSEVEVQVTDIVPGVGCQCGQSFVHPVVAVKVPKPVSSATVVHRLSATDCGR